MIQLRLWSGFKVLHPTGKDPTGMASAKLGQTET
jgi:hypothetical protein